MDLADYSRIFRERWIVIALCLLLALGAAYAITRAATPMYQASAVLFLKVDSDSGSLYDRSQFSVQRVKSYPELVDSPRVLAPVINELGLKMSEQELARMVGATNPIDTVSLKVTALSANARQAQAIANSVSKYLSAEVGNLEASKDATQSIELIVTVPAQTPVSPQSPDLKVNLALGALSGLAGGLILSLLLALGDRHIRTSRDIRRASGLPLIAQLPTEAHLWRGSFGRGSATRSKTSYGEIVTNLQLISDGRMPECLLLVPATKKVASLDVRVRLATALAKSGRSTCLLEADTEAQKSLPHFPLLGRVTLSDVVVAARHLNDAILRPADLPFAIVPVGDEDSLPRRSVTESALENVVTRLRGDFDLCLVQATSTSRPIDMVMIAPLSDAVVILAEYGRTRRDELLRVRAQLEAARIRPLGVILISVPAWRRQVVLSDWVEGDVVELHPPAAAAPLTIAKLTHRARN